MKSFVSKNRLASQLYTTIKSCQAEVLCYVITKEIIVELGDVYLVRIDFGNGK